MSLFLVDTKTPGFTRGQNLDKIGQHAGDTSELFFNDLRVPTNALLGGVEGQGFVQMMRELPRERLVIGVQAVYGAKGTLDATVKYVQERQAFSQAIGQFQNTRFTLAQCASDIAAAEAFLNVPARTSSSDERRRKEKQSPSNDRGKIPSREGVAPCRPPSTPTSPRSPPSTTWA